MKKAFFLSTVVGTAIVLSIAAFSSGCGESCNGATVLPADWASAGFKPVDGGSVCTYDDKNATIHHKGVGLPDLAAKYSDQLKASGWKVSDLDRQSLAIYADKDSSKFSVQFHECFKTLGTCTDAMIRRDK